MPHDLTRRELQIIRMITEDCIDSRIIAARLKLSIKTVEVHRCNAMKKMQWHNVMEMCKWWWSPERLAYVAFLRATREGVVEGQAGKVATQVSS